MKKLLLILICFFISFDVKSKSQNVIKLFCEYDQNKLKRKFYWNGNLVEDEGIDRSKMCKRWSCSGETIEVQSYKSPDKKTKFLFKNHIWGEGGVELDVFLMTENNITIDTFLELPVGVDSYIISRVTGKVKKTFYNFEWDLFYRNLNKVEEIQNRRGKSLYDDKRRLPLKTLQSFSIPPFEIIYLEGKCQKETGRMF